MNLQEERDARNKALGEEFLANIDRYFNCFQGGKVAHAVEHPDCGVTAYITTFETSRWQMQVITTVDAVFEKQNTQVFFCEIYPYVRHVCSIGSANGWMFPASTAIPKKVSA